MKGTDFSHFPLPRLKGRGAAENPAGRFEKFDYVPEAEIWETDDPRPPRKTQFFKDTSRSVIAYNRSPDIPFEASLNPYRGCEHGCIYCYARPSHEYLGLSAGLDFESKIFVKYDAPRLLRQTLMSRAWRPQTIAISGNTDPYQPAERHFQLTRQCLQVLAEFRNPAGVITKNDLVTRDIDVLRELAAYGAVSVAISITTLDGELARRMEPRAATPQRRLVAIEQLAAAGIPVAVMTAPIIPGLNDHEIPQILTAAAAAGATCAAYVMLRLPHGIKDLFRNWLARHYPERKEKVLNRIRDVRGGKLNNPNFGERMRGEGIYADQVNHMFQLACRRLGLNQRRTGLSTAAFRRPGAEQLTLF